MSCSIRKPCRRHGMLTADAIFGIFILGAAMVILLVAVSRQNLAELRLADARRATALAEATLTDLQSGSNRPTTSPDARVAIEGCPDARHINGFRWARVTATVNNQARSLTGLVPESALPEPTTKEATP